MKLIFALISAAACLNAGPFNPVNNDLWQFTNPGFSISSPNPGTGCGAASNLFGNTAAGPTDGFIACPTENGNGNIILADNVSGITTIEWNTALMNLTGFELTLSNTADNRPLSRMQLAFWNGTSFVEFYDSGANAFAFGNMGFPVTLGSPVQASRWLVTFTNLPAQFTGARINELDGFGSLATQSAIPEPGSAALALTGLAGLAYFAKRKR